MKRVEFIDFKPRELTVEELAFEKEQREYCKKFLPNDCEIIKITQNEDDRFPTSFTFKQIGEDNFLQGILIKTPYGIKKDILNEMRSNNLLSIQKVREYSFDTYETIQQWQKEVKQKALDYVDQFDNTNYQSNKWFTITGLTGSGKSHIATSIVFGLASKLVKTTYISWVQLKNDMKNDLDKAGELVHFVKTRPVLYLDDFLKVGLDEQRPSNYELEQAINIIWYRYEHNLPTIISSEYDIETTVNNYSGAIAGRIIENSKDYLVIIGDDKSRNYRLQN